MKSGPGSGDELRGYQLPVNWSLLRRDCDDLFARYGWRLTIGTFDAAIVTVGQGPRPTSLGPHALTRQASRTIVGSQLGRAADDAPDDADWHAERVHQTIGGVSTPAGQLVGVHRL